MEVDHRRVGRHEFLQLGIARPDLLRAYVKGDEAKTSADHLVKVGSYSGGPRERWQNKGLLLFTPLVEVTHWAHRGVNGFEVEVVLASQAADDGAVTIT